MAVRAMVNDSEQVAMTHARFLLDLEIAAGLDWERGLQQFSLDRPVLVTACNWVYSWTYWPVVTATFLYTWLYRRTLYYQYRNAMLFSGAVGLLIFALYPVAPPRFLPGYVDTVDTGERTQFVAHPSFLINDVAALPSFHVGWVALASVVLAASVATTWAQWLCAVPPASMAVAVVITGNHFVVDIVAGIAIALGGLAVARRVAGSATS
jgi:hypothetical protein